mmetsp:Transcript_25265/g.71981  ORF Transcript_25265/g.71981 Transcript_25265/m.71981 type:complete len:488 (-) Transcript_25265:304-1767(-)
MTHRSASCSSAPVQQSRFRRAIEERGSPELTGAVALSAAALAGPSDKMQMQSSACSSSGGGDLFERPSANYALTQRRKARFESDGVTSSVGSSSASVRPMSAVAARATSSGPRPSWSLKDKRREALLSRGTPEPHGSYPVSFPMRPSMFSSQGASSVATSGRESSLSQPCVRDVATDGACFRSATDGPRHIGSGMQPAPNSREFVIDSAGSSFRSCEVPEAGTSFTSFGSSGYDGMPNRLTHGGPRGWWNGASYGASSHSVGGEQGSSGANGGSLAVDQAIMALLSARPEPASVLECDKHDEAPMPNPEPPLVPRPPSMPRTMTASTKPTVAGRRVHRPTSAASAVSSNQPIKQSASNGSISDDDSSSSSDSDSDSDSSSDVEEARTLSSATSAVCSAGTITPVGSQLSSARATACSSSSRNTVSFEEQFGTSAPCDIFFTAPLRAEAAPSGSAVGRRDLDGIQERRTFVRNRGTSNKDVLSRDFNL